MILWSTRDARVAHAPSRLCLPATRSEADAMIRDPRSWGFAHTVRVPRPLFQPPARAW
jgi:hypothetical protein